MNRPVKPLWTAAPSRFAGWSRPAAIGALLLLLLGLTASLDASRSELDGSAEPALYAGAVEAMRHGSEFHPALASVVRAGGEPAGLLAYPPPALAAVAAPLPPVALSALLFALAGAAFLAWQPVLGAALARPGARMGAWALLAAGLVPYLRPSLAHAPDVWAGLFTALSLGLWARGGWLEAAAFGLAAGLAREVAGVYLLVMFLFALRSGKRGEALAWGAALLVLAGAVAAHWRAVTGEVGPLGLTGAWEWRGLGGFVRAVVEASPLAMLPIVVAAPLIVVALFGWIAWSAPAGLRVAAAMAGAAAVFPFAPGLWGYLVAAPLLAGLAFVPDGMRDLVRAALGARRRGRITVTRVVR